MYGYVETAARLRLLASVVRWLWCRAPGWAHRTAPRRMDPAWWTMLAASLAPMLLVGGWVVAHMVQPSSYSPVRQSISVLAGRAGTDRWIRTGALFGVGCCYLTMAAGLTALCRAARLAGRRDWQRLRARPGRATQFRRPSYLPGDCRFRPAAGAPPSVCSRARPTGAALGVVPVPSPRSVLVGIDVVAVTRPVGTPCRQAPRDREDRPDAAPGRGRSRRRRGALSGGSA